MNTLDRYNQLTRQADWYAERGYVSAAADTEIRALIFLGTDGAVDEPIEWEMCDMIDDEGQEPPATPRTMQSVAVAMVIEAVAIAAALLLWGLLA